MKLVRQAVVCTLVLAAACVAPPMPRVAHVGRIDRVSPQTRTTPQPRTTPCANPPVPSNRVGVLLPLSGRYQQHGERALSAIRIAFGDAAVELIVRDTAGDAGRASQAVSELANRRVTAIIGPVLGATALAAAHTAETLCVPIVTLSHRANLPEVGPWVFRSALTAEAQARALAEIAFRVLGMKRFALLFPRNAYGEEFALAFAAEVDRRQGEIRAVESYDLDETTFRTPVQKLVGLYDDSVPLWPIIDFDAIVVPDTAVRLGMIASALAFADVVLTQDPKQVERIRRDMGIPSVDPIRLLGGSTWNNQRVLDYCARDCEWAVFVDGFFADSPEVRVRDFVAAFRTQRNAEPELLDAIAFDTAAMVHSLLDRGAPNRDELRAGLLDITHEGLTGTLRFTAGGETNRALRALTIRDQTIRAL